MKIFLGCIVALSLCATSARADEPEWSIGAGIGYAYGYGVSFGASGLGYSAPYLYTSAPQASTSVERRLSSANWLLLGVTGNFSREMSRLPAVSASSLAGNYATDTKQGGGAISFGVRHFLTEPGAFIGVSLHAALQAGVQTVSEDYTAYDGAGGAVANHATATAWSLGGFAGLALDKPLMDRLTLRLAVALLSIDYQKTTASPSIVQGAGSSFDASVIFSPDLELRLAF